MRYSLLFWTYITLNGIPISLSGCQASECAVEGRSLFEVTHLASLGVKIRETAFRDKNKRENLKVHKKGTYKRECYQRQPTKEGSYKRWFLQKTAFTKEDHYKRIYKVQKIRIPGASRMRRPVYFYLRSSAPISLPAQLLSAWKARNDGAWNWCGNRRCNMSGRTYWDLLLRKAESFACSWYFVYIFSFEEIFFLHKVPIPIPQAEIIMPITIYIKLGKRKVKVAVPVVRSSTYCVYGTVRNVMDAIITHNQFPLPQ